jgi:propanol-preferring alcohol dehydrogenase
MTAKTQTAAWLDAPKHGATLRIRHDIPIPEPTEGQVLVKLEVTGFWY